MRSKAPTSHDIEAFLDSEEMKLDKLLEKVQKESPEKRKKKVQEQDIGNIFEQHLDSSALKKEMEKLRQIDQEQK